MQRGEKNAAFLCFLAGKNIKNRPSKLGENIEKYKTYGKNAV